MYHSNKSTALWIATLISVLLTVLILFFIFFNSAQDGSASSQYSRLFTQWINQRLEILPFPLRFHEHFIRKLAHFTEFALLGLSVMLTLRTVFAARSFSLPLLFCFGVAALDELSQFLSAGRTPKLTDVCIDLCGSITGVLIGTMLLWIAKKMRYVLNRKRN